MTDVVPIWEGVPVPNQVSEPVESCVQTLEELLAAARAGEIVGVVLAAQHADNTGSYRIAGRIGSYSLTGALLKVQHALLTHTEDG